jgi:alkanesulfonate monooxygenase SsuD/methylene tetrahydromethanopterin reductase-like flavin-dependent oxidoreductase (luciferase family)
VDRSATMGGAETLRFGLFGGAKAAGTGPDADSHGYRQFIDYVIAAEALGFESLFVVEHHFTGVGQVSASLNLLSFLAARTRRIRLGTAVVVLPWHNPLLLAEQASTLDLLSGGRLDLGIGKGYRASEFAGFCIPQAEADARFDEAVEVLRQAWTSPGRFSHHGPRWHFENVVVEPRPLQRPHPPLWMAAGSPVSIRRAARDGFHLLLDQIAPTELSLERAALYRDTLEASGRARDSGRIALARALQYADTDAERTAQRQVRRRVLERIGDLARGPGAERYRNATSLADADLADDDAALIGTTDEIIGRLRRLAAGGIDMVLLVDPTGTTESLRRFAAEIMPAFGSPGTTDTDT